MKLIEKLSWLVTDGARLTYLRCKDAGTGLTNKERAEMKRLIKVESDILNSPGQPSK